MRIAVIEHADGGDYSEYIFSLIEESARQHSYQLKLCSTSVPASQQQVADNAVVFISIESTSQLILNWLYKVKIPFILKKIKADVVIDLNGIASDKIKIPQLIILEQTFFKSDVKQLSKIEKFALKNFKHSKKFAADFFIYSQQKKESVTINNKEHLQAIPFTAPEIFRTFEWHDKIMVKAQHADNKEYFVTVIEDNDVDGFVLLLQAFSRFKKWQQSGMQLLVLPKYQALDAAIEQKHKTYKYRDDVRLIEGIEEKQIAAIFASAYAFVHIAKSQANLFIISIAVQCSLPVISFQDDDVKEYAGDAGLFYTEKNAEALGHILIQLYKDENLHAQLKASAAKQAANLNRKEYEDNLWHLIQTATLKA